VAAALNIISDPEAAAAVLAPLRARILASLGEPGSATTVAEELGIPRQKTNYHVRQLERLGLVEHVEDRRRRNCTERVVRAAGDRFLISPSVLGELAPGPEELADERSGAHLAAVCARTVSDVGALMERARATEKRLPTFSIETAVRFSTPADQAAFLDELSAAVSDLVRRYHDERAPDGRWFRILAGAHPARRLPSTEEEGSPSLAGPATNNEGEG
jgi:DNA-binding transcriptional ArsR family regulator